MELSSKPVHVDSTDDEPVARVAAIHVAKDSGMVCTRVPDEARPGKRATTVWSVQARTSCGVAKSDCSVDLGKRARSLILLARYRS
ncbi:MAG: hypothetical protein ACYDAQ_20665 [Mycobacteriales bacterium]